MSIKLMSQVWVLPDLTPVEKLLLLSIADNTKIGAQSGIHRSVEKPGGRFFGSPALPQREAFRIQGGMVQLPDLLVTFRQMKQKIEELERAIEELRRSSTNSTRG